MYNKIMANGNGEMSNAYVGNPKCPYPHGSICVCLHIYIYGFYGSRRKRG